MQDLELQEALQEVLSHKQGNLMLENRMLNLFSQKEFADLFGVSLRTLQQWEQGRRSPQGAAQVLLKVISYNPKIVQEALRH